MKEISLKYMKGIVLLDDENHEELSKYIWSILYGPNTSYARTSIKENGIFKHYLMHRLIMNNPKGFEVDHIDNNGLNNQMSNLRLVTHSQNQMNSHKYKDKTSKYKGVMWHKRDKIWEVQIKANNKQHYLGRFENEIQAAIMYNIATEILHKEYAFPNDIEKECPSLTQEDIKLLKESIRNNNKLMKRLERL